MAGGAGKRYGPVADFCATYGFGPWDCPNSETVAGLNAAMKRVNANRALLDALGHGVSQNVETAIAVGADAGLSRGVLARIRLASMPKKGDE